MELNLASVISMASQPVKTALSVNILVHIQKQQNQNLSVPQTCPHLLIQAHPPQDSAEYSMLQVSWRWDLGFKL